MATAARQIDLFGGGAPAIGRNFERVRRIALNETSWVEHVPSWVSGHEALLDVLTRTTRWQSLRRKMYDDAVDVPRLVASLADDDPAHPLLEQARLALSQRYETDFTHITFALYRDGRDSVAWHGDYVARDSLADALVASVSLGEPRRLLLRPRRHPGSRPSGTRSLAFSLGWGVMVAA
jgi:alkylated DNA repair dioxygenase AlkB